MGIKFWVKRIIRGMLRRIEGLGRKNVYLGDHRILTKTWFDVMLMLDARELSLTPYVLMYGYYELAETYCLRRLLKPGMTVVDIGANVGYFSTHAKRFMRGTGRVIAYEPNPVTHDILMDNFMLNGMSDMRDVRCMAMGNSLGNARFWVAQKHPANSSFFEHCATHIFRDEKLTEIIVGQTTIDQEFSGMDVDFMKIDAEGSEPEIFEGGHQVFSRKNAPHILMEYYRPFYPDKAQLLIEKILSYGYTFYRIKRNGVPIPVLPQEFQDSDEFASLLLMK